MHLFNYAGPSGRAVLRPLACWDCIYESRWGHGYLSVYYECWVLSGTGICDELITRAEESYRLWCVLVCDLEISWMRTPQHALGRSATRKKNLLNYTEKTFCVKTCSNACPSWTEDWQTLHTLNISSTYSTWVSAWKVTVNALHPLHASVTITVFCRHVTCCIRISCVNIRVHIS